ncbi:S8 family serine peptidase [Candidatus Villigracilis affinis]|uniref:S8 family serine peptidase n=1 Tax=Candidatus Villigracilis affinis TaxID=3140682 RepID=UPI001DDD024A|nr:S8 family serine peptidase [Anaerolineales bacterium]
MKNPSIKYIVMAVLLVIFIVASLVMNQGTGNPAVSSEPQTDETSSYVPKSEPLKLDAPSQPVPQQVVIQFAPEATEAERAAYIESIGGTVVQSITSLDTIVVNVSEEVAQAPLPASDAVTASEADYYVSALDDVAPVNDPHYADQWALPAIAAPEAWASMSVDAAAVTIAVIDSGICVSHPDLAGRIVSGWDFVESDTMPQDDFGHGCSVSGVIAANMNDGIGIAGVAPNANIMPLRVLNGSGFGSYSDVAAAVVYAVDNGAQVINLSLGGSSPSSTLENAINYAAANGVIVVAAAGNNGTEGALYPAAYPSVIAVGSIDPNLLHSTFSNYGSQVDVWAPGRDIMSTNRSGDYSLVSGTSFAAPYVAGAEAVYMALSRTPVFAGGLLTFATQVEVPVDPTATSVVPTDVPVVEISDAAVLDQLRQLYDVPSGVDASIRTIEQAGGVMFGLFIVPAPDGVDAGPSAHYFTATQNGDALTISQEYTPQFSEALDALGASGAVSQGLVTAFNSVAAQGDGTAQLGLPWTSGVNATLVAGPHGDGFQPTPTGVSSALDFAPADNKVLASREGYAQQIVCPGETLSSWVIITHPDGWRTSYYQLVNIQVDPDGQQVGRGAYLGDIAPNGAAAFLCGGSTFTTPLVHFSVLRDGKQVKINGFDIGGWTVGASSLTRVSDSAVVNVGGSVLNNGTFGTDLTCDATSVPAGYIKCADEGGTCSFPGLETVYFGSNNGCFATETATTSISCDDPAFGMPAGDSRSCYVDTKSITLAPACPQSGGVILYWTKDYACTGAGADAGYRLQAASGSQDYGVDTAFNDKASALRVPAGWSVMLYGGGGNTGEMLCVNKDVSDLSLLGTFPLTSSVIDNGVSSMQVFTNSTNCNGDLLANPPKALLPANGSSKPNGFSPILQWAAALNAIEYQAEWWDTDTPNTKNACLVSAL